VSTWRRSSTCARRASCAPSWTGGSSSSTPPPRLEARRRHSVDAVVDRLRVRADAAQRLAESFETALGLSQGVARVAFQDEPAARRWSSRTAMRAPPAVTASPASSRGCSRSTTRPGRAAPAAASACRNISTRHGWWSTRPCRWRWRRARLGPAQRVLFPADPGARTPLPLRHRDAVGRPAGSSPARAAVGSGEERVEFRYFDGARRQRRVAAIRGKASCPTSSGATARPSRPRCGRNSPSTRHARLRRLRWQSSQPRRTARIRRGRTLSQVAALPIAEARRFFTTLEVEGWRGEIARRLVREITDRLTFLVDVGLDYLSLDRSAETLSGARRNASGSPARSAPAWSA